MKTTMSISRSVLELSTASFCLLGACTGDQIADQDYPNILVTTGLHDSQVQYWEPAKWVAKLREHKTDDNILIMKTACRRGTAARLVGFSTWKTQRWNTDS